MIFKYWLLAVIFYSQTNFISSQSPKIEVNGFFDCVKSLENNAVTITFKEDPPRVDIDIDLESDITGSDMVELVGHKSVNGKWEKNVVETSDTVDRVMDSILGKAWDKLKSASDQKIEGNTLPAGKYSWTDMEFSPTDVTPPGGLEGLIQLEVVVYSEDTPMFCIAGEGKISK